MSINQLIRVFPRERLIVAPLSWTSRHLEVLQCSFEIPAPAPPTTQANFTGEEAGLIHICRLLFTWYTLRSDRAMLGFIASPECPLKIG